MPNFDALRPAVVGPLSYLCKPQKPADLLGLWTFQGNLDDLSRYGHTLSSLSSYSFTTAGYGQAITNATGAFPCSVSGDFSFEWIISAPPDGGHQGFVVLNWDFRNAYNYGGNGLWYYSVGGGGGSYVGDITPYTAMMHVALVRRSTTLYVFINGIKKATIPSASGTLGNISFNCTSQNLQNVRLVGKALGTTTSYPVPSGIYTGYEAL